MNYTVVLHFKSNDYNGIDIRADAPVSLAEGTELIFSEYALAINYYAYNHASDSSNYLNSAMNS